MGTFDTLLSGVAGTSDERESRPVDASRPGEDLSLQDKITASRELEKRLDASGSVQKQDVDRRASLPSALQDALDDEDAAPKPYDPELLRDLSSSTIPQTYVDTLAQDASSANWRLVPTDEDADVSQEQIAQAERKLRDLVPDSTFSEFLEEWSRTLLRLGDGTVVKHYPGGNTSNPVGEIVHIDSATMFKVTDDRGFTEGYVQFTKSENRAGKEEFDGTPFELEEVVWTSWARRGNTPYGEGPVEKGRDSIEVLEEIAEKEILDLIQGMPPGIVSRPPDTELPIDSADWENFKDDMRLNEGERHRLAYTKFPVEYTALSPNYQELQLLDRYHTKVTELGGVFKVNPSYAGFDFENTNRATDESQQEAYKQRGFQVLITRLEQALTLGVVPDLGLDIGTDLKFQFERETTVGERKSKASALQESIKAGKEAADAGLSVSWRDGMPVIDDGPMEAGNAGSSGGGGAGGLFGSADRPRLPDYDSDPRSVEVEEAVGLSKNRNAVVLAFPPGGVAHGDDSEWTGFLNRLLDLGADKIVDLKGRRNGNDRVYPPDLPDSHDPVLAVHGLDEATIRGTLNSYEDVYLRVVDGPTEQSKDAGGSGNGSSSGGSRLSKDEVETLDETLFRAHREQIYPDSVEEIEKASFSPSEVPDYVVDKIREAIDDGAVFQGIDALGDEFTRAKERLEELLLSNLTEDGGDGWSLREIRDDIQETFPNVDKEQAEVVARTETSSVLNNAREKGYEEREDAATLRYIWTGPDDSRTTDACEELKDLTDPRRGEGGSPMTMPELVRAESEVHGTYFSNLQFRKHTIHPNERHTFRRWIEGAM
ncbi:MAG: phage portal protein [Candidatus Wenzhouxiangella sp. M2_3B_020]